MSTLYYINNKVMGFMQKRLAENDGNGFIKPRGHAHKAEFIRNRGGDEGSCWYGTWRVESSMNALQEIRREGSEQQCLGVSN